MLEPAGIDRAEEAALQHVRMIVRFAVAEPGIPAFGRSLAAVAAPERLRAEAEAARRLSTRARSRW